MADQWRQCITFPFPTNLCSITDKQLNSCSYIHHSIPFHPIIPIQSQSPSPFSEYVLQNCSCEYIPSPFCVSSHTANKSQKKRPPHHPTNRPKCGVQKVEKWKNETTENNNVTGSEDIGDTQNQNEREKVSQNKLRKHMFIAMRRRTGHESHSEWKIKRMWIQIQLGPIRDRKSENPPKAQRINSSVNKHRERIQKQVQALLNNKQHVTENCLLNLQTTRENPSWQDTFASSTVLSKCFTKITTRLQHIDVIFLFLSVLGQIVQRKQLRLYSRTELQALKNSFFH